jgi:hypothetical protein
MRSFIGVFSVNYPFYNDQFHPVTYFVNDPVNTDPDPEQALVPT